MKKILFISVLIFSLLTTTQTAYSYFEQESTQVISNDVALYELEPQIVEQNKYLVPLGTVLGVDDTYYYEFKYEVILEDDIDVSYEIQNLVWENSNLTEEELQEIFNFDISTDHIETVSISNGLLSDKTTGSLVEITITVSMNNHVLLHNYNTELGQELDFTYVLTVSNQ